MFRRQTQLSQLKRCFQPITGFILFSSIYKYTYTHPFNGPLSGTTRVAGTRKVRLIWILLKQETVSGSGISWAICKSASSSRQITMRAPHHSVFYRPDALPAAQPTASKHWRPIYQCTKSGIQNSEFTTQLTGSVNVASFSRNCTTQYASCNAVTQQISSAITWHTEP